MEERFYRDRLAERFGIDAMVPGAADRHEVNRIVFDELVRGIISPASKAVYLDVIRKGRAEGADSVVFACTEIGLLLSPDDIDCPVHDTAKLHSRAAVCFRARARPERETRHEARHRQQGLLVLVAAALDPDASARHPLRGGPDPARHAGVPAARRRLQGGRHGADPRGRRRHGVGVARHHGLSSASASRSSRSGRRSAGRGPSRAPSRRRCMRASAACARPAP